MGAFKGDFLKGIFYTGIAKYTGIAVSIIVTAILARLISPKDFGIVAIATVFINFFSILTTVGISPAIIQNKSITYQELQSINSATFLFAFIITVLYLLLIPVLLSFYDENEQLTQIMFLLGTCIFFSIAAIVPNALIMKEKLFKFIAVRTFVLQILLGALSVIGACCGMGIYALLINPIIGSILLFIINYIKFPIGFKFISKGALDKILSFSVFQTLFNLVYLSYRNVDKLFIGRYFGLSPLGYYEKSYRLMMLPLENVSAIISPVLHPLLSDMQTDKEKLWHLYLHMLRFLSEFSFMISVLLYFISAPLILIFYGEQWQEAVPLFKILTLSVSVQILQAPIGAFLQSINQVKGLLYGALWILLLVVISLGCALVFNSLIVVPIGIVVSFFIGFGIYQYYIAYYFQKKTMEILKVFYPYIIISFFLYILLYSVDVIWDMKNIWTQLVVFVTVTLLYMLILMYFDKMTMTRDMVISIIKKIKI